ncbi:MAG: hypothetical protein Q9191_000142 [Dirinaria sp. TL-2023a]
MAEDATRLLSTLLSEYKRGYGVGSMSCSIYDTAWISCVSKKSAATPRQWLFPSSFQYIVDSQQNDGGWHWPPQHTPECKSGTIISSLAALFAIAQHVKDPLQLRWLESRANECLAQGQAFLSRYFENYRSSSDYSVGFEVLVPALLELLNKEGINFSFHGKQGLFEKRAKRVAKLPISQLDRIPSTALHSIEAFYGDDEFSFDVLRDQLINGSVMASPSATAAYLMRCKTWDDDAEAYLRLTICNAAGMGSGAVPSAYPSTNFELLWVASVLLKASCLTIEHVAQDDSCEICVLRECIPEGGLPDVDDSAIASITMSLLGYTGSSSDLRRHFETKTHFETYKNEGSESLSANCSLLLALLLDIKNDPDAFPAIEKVSLFVVTKWFNAGGSVKDKWNLSEYYSIMLLAQAFVALLRNWEGGHMDLLSWEVAEQIVIVAFRCLCRVLHSQNKAGSWGCRGPREETAYAILALVDLVSLPMASMLNQQVHSAILRGREYLKATDGLSEPEFLWVEKVVYGIKYVSKAYIIAAQHAPKSAPLKENRISKVLRIEYSSMAKMVDLVQQVPLLKSQPRWLLVSSWLEGQLMLSKLNKTRRPIFDRAAVSKDKYVLWIPFIWALVNNMHGCNLSERLMFAMMRLSVLNFQVDEFMESVLDESGHTDVAVVRKIIDGSLEEPGSPNENQDARDGAHTSNRTTKHSSLISADKHLDLSDDAISDMSSDKPNTASYKTFHQVGSFDPTIVPSTSLMAQQLQRFVESVDDVIGDVCVSDVVHALIRKELRVFLHAHLTQAQLNRRFFLYKQATNSSTANRQPIVFADTKAVPSFRDWLHKSAAIHTSCPYSFTLYLALASSLHHAPFLQSLQQRYILEDLCGHLARMCRLYNDYGSLQRDLAEGNLNCVNFPDFHDDDDAWESMATAGSAGRETAKYTGSSPENMTVEARMKARLMDLADWEREGINNAMTALERCPEIECRLINTVKVFVDVTDLFGQIYAVKDLASRKTISQERAPRY